MTDKGHIDNLNKVIDLIDNKPEDIYLQFMKQYIVKVCDSLKERVHKNKLRLRKEQEQLAKELL